MNRPTTPEERKSSAPEIFNKATNWALRQASNLACWVSQLEKVTNPNYNETKQINTRVIPNIKSFISYPNLLAQVIRTLDEKNLASSTLNTMYVRDEDFSQVMNEFLAVQSKTNRTLDITYQHNGKGQKESIEFNGNTTPPNRICQWLIVQMVKQLGARETNPSDLIHITPSQIQSAFFERSEHFASLSSLQQERFATAIFEQAHILAFNFENCLRDVKVGRQYIPSSSYELVSF